jgi:hypothetical protein
MLGMVDKDPYFDWLSYDDDAPELEAADWG